MAIRGRPSRDDELRGVYRRHVQAVYAFLGYSVRAHVAEDLTASTFERVVKAWHSFDPALASERTWILAIARNVLTDHLRREQHRQGPSVDEQPALLDRLSGSEEPYAQVLERAMVAGWLEALPEREREVLALRYGADLPAAEIAEFLGLSAANVHQIVSRSLRRLREVARTSAARD